MLPSAIDLWKTVDGYSYNISWVFYFSIILYIDAMSTKLLLSSFRCCISCVDINLKVKVILLG